MSETMIYALEARDRDGLEGDHGMISIIGAIQTADREELMGRNSIAVEYLYYAINLYNQLAARVGVEYRGEVEEIEARLQGLEVAA